MYGGQRAAGESQFSAPTVFPSILATSISAARAFVEHFQIFLCHFQPANTNDSYTCKRIDLKSHGTLGFQSIYLSILLFHLSGCFDIGDERVKHEDGIQGVGTTFRTWGRLLRFAFVALKMPFLLHPG